MCKTKSLNQCIQKLTVIPGERNGYGPPIEDTLQNDLQKLHFQRFKNGKPNTRRDSVFIALDKRIELKLNA